MDNWTTLFSFLLTIIATVSAHSPTPCEVKREDETGQHVICSSISNFHTIISYLEQVNAVPSHLVIAVSPSLIIIRSDFEHPVFDNLERLEFWRNNFTTFNPESLTGLPKLHGLTIAYCNLTYVDANMFAGLNLTILQLNNNQIGDVDEEAFRNQVHISDLVLSNNLLTSLPPTLFQGLTDLDTLLLDGNNLERIDENLFQGLIYLDNLKLSKNKIRSFSFNTFESLPQLRKLDLSENQLEKLEINLFQSNSKLAHLDISENKFSSLDSATLNISSLTEFIAKKNNIHTISSYNFILNPNLVVINLGHNNINTTQTRAFETLNKLKVVYLAGNNLLSVIVDGFRQESRKDGDTFRYGIIVENRKWDCSLPDFVALRAWFEANEFEFNKMFECDSDLNNHIEL